MSVIQSLSFNQNALRDKDLKIADLHSKLEGESVARKVSDEELAKHWAGTDQELTTKLEEKTAELLKLSLELAQKVLNFSSLGRS